MRWLIAGVLLVACAARGGIAQSRSASTPLNVLVRVQAAAEGTPLGYAVVALPALGIERFTGASGTVVLLVPDRGPQRLVIKRLGFTPKDTIVDVSDAPSQVVTIGLARVSFRLEAVRVVGWPACTSPGMRDADDEVRGIVDQLRQNAERYRLLTTTYPFTYMMERESGSRASDGSYIAELRVTMMVSGTPAWRYKPGTLVAHEGGAWVMRIPSIGDLAEDAFVDNHCFHVAGLETKDEVRLLRIDIVAAQRLRGVDVHVVVWLDPSEYRLRHATFTLTKPPSQVRGLISSTSSARYMELIPFVPVLDLLTAENTAQVGRTRGETLVFVERQKNKGVIYTGAKPDSLATDPLSRDSLPGVRPPR